MTSKQLSALFRSTEYQQMLKDHKEEMKRVDAEGVKLFLSLLNPRQKQTPST